MTTIAFDIFYRNWIKKADSYTNDTLIECFDKFISLYILFNALYMEVVNELIFQGQKIPKDYSDKKAATHYVVQFLGSKFYLDNLLNDNISIESLMTIFDIINRQEFNIILENRIFNRDLDLELLRQLKASSRQEKAKAILCMLYHIRFNMFHGHKGLEEGQLKLLKPVSYLLHKTIIITYNKLSEDKANTTIE